MSLPLRERGFWKYVLSERRWLVAPPAGAWIETLSAVFLLPMRRVAPPAGAWIETGSPGHPHPKPCVAPPAGAWIETRGWKIVKMNLLVAPPAGAWIETIVLLVMVALLQSLPLRERGLKLGDIEDSLALDEGRSPCGSVD